MSPEALLTVAIGFLSGVLSGAFGIGGGIVTTPAIRLLLGAPALIAVGTPLPVIFPSAVTGAITYARRGVADVRSGLWIGAAGALTTVVGAWLTTKVGGTVVLLATAVLVFYAAADMALQAWRGPRAPAPFEPDVESASASALEPGDPSAQHAPVGVGRLLAAGAVTGLYSGFLGLGGGFVLVPLLTRWMRFPIKRAIATSLVAVALIAVPGTITHALLGHIDWAIAGLLVIGVVPGALVGARLTLGARERSIRIAFSVLLMGIGVWLAYSEIARVLS